MAKIQVTLKKVQLTTFEIEVKDGMEEHAAVSARVADVGVFINGRPNIDWGTPVHTVDHVEVVR